MTFAGAASPCPCGTSRSYDACCGPLHRGERPAATAVEVMRSRYSAHARGEADHLFRTWHPRTRPADVLVDPALTWTGLEVLAAEAGGEDDDAGTVEFRAHFRGPAGPGTLHELSRFARRGGRWVYVEGDQLSP